MSTQTSNDNKVGIRLRQYRRRERLVNLIGGAFAGSLAVYSALSFSPEHPVPAWLQVLVPSLLVLGTALLAYARVNFEWNGELIERAMELDKNLTATSDLPSELKDYPMAAEVAYIGEMLTAAAIAFFTVLVAYFTAT